MQRLFVLGFLVVLAPSCLLFTSLDGLEGPPLDDASVEREAGGQGGHDEADGLLDSEPPDASLTEADAPDTPPSEVDAADASDAPPDAAADADETGDGRPPEPILFQTTSGVPLGITTGPSDVYWTETSFPGLLRAPKNSQNPTSGVHVEALADNLGDPFDVAVDDTYLYWTEQKTANTVWRRPLHAGMDAGAKQSFFSGPGTTEYLAVGPGFGYVTAASLNLIAVGPKGSLSTSDQLYPLQADVSGLAIVGDTLYWSIAAGDGSKLVAGSTSSGTAPSTVAAVAGTVSGVAADAKDIYWIADGRRVMGMNVVARQPQVLLYESDSDMGQGDIAIDGGRIYFTAPLAKAIFALPRSDP
jgi:hypothetical protein